MSSADRSVPVVVLAARGGEDDSAEKSEPFSIKPGLGVIGSGEFGVPFDGGLLPDVSKSSRDLGPCTEVA
jgi:hypothetical protein